MLKIGNYEGIIERNQLPFEIINMSAYKIKNNICPIEIECELQIGEKLFLGKLSVVGGWFGTSITGQSIGANYDSSEYYIKLFISSNYNNRKSIIFIPNNKNELEGKFSIKGLQCKNAMFPFGSERIQITLK